MKVKQVVSPSFLFVIGLLIAPALIIQDNLLIKLFQTLFFMVSVMAVINSVKPLFGSLIFFITTVLLNILSPVGKVLFRIGSFPITEGALTSGLSKGLAVLSLLYLSRFSVRGSVILPGFLGRYVSKTMFFLNTITQEKAKIRRKNLILNLDSIFENIYSRVNTYPIIQKQRNAGKLRKSRLSGIIVLFILLLVNWGLVFFP